MKTSPWVPIALGVLVVAALWLWQRERQSGAADRATYEERMRVLSGERDSLAGRAARTDTQYVTDTAALREAAARFARRAARVDTQWLHDTIPVPVEVVREIVASADTTIRACRAALTTCEQRVADRDSVIAVERRLRATGDSLTRALLRQSLPRFTPFVEGGVDPLHQWALAARAGVDVRTFGAFKLTAAILHSTSHHQHTTAFAGVRVTF